MNAIYAQFIAKLRELFGKDNQAGACETQLLQRVRASNETIQELRICIERLAEWAYPGEKGSRSFIRNTRDAFIRALNDKRLMEEVWRQRPADIDEAAEVAKDFENQFIRARQAPVPAPAAATVPAAVQSITVNPPTNSNDSMMNEMRQLV